MRLGSSAARGADPRIVHWLREPNIYMSKMSEEQKVMAQLQAEYKKKEEQIGRPKAGGFTNWTEDEQTIEISLPTKGISKNLVQFSLSSSESIAMTNKTKRSAQKLEVKNKMSGQTLLLVDPLAGLVDELEATWLLDKDGFLCISLAKAQLARGEPPVWGETLCAKGGRLECYMTVAEVTAARQLREARERNRERERLERVEESRRRLREKSEQEAEAARKETQGAHGPAQGPRKDPTKPSAVTSVMNKFTWSNLLSRAGKQLLSGLPMMGIILLAKWYGFQSGGA